MLRLVVVAALALAMPLSTPRVSTPRPTHCWLPPFADRAPLHMSPYSVMPCSPRLGEQRTPQMLGVFRIIIIPAACSCPRPLFVPCLDAPTVLLTSSRLSTRCPYRTSAVSLKGTNAQQSRPSLVYVSLPRLDALIGRPPAAAAVDGDRQRIGAAPAVRPAKPRCHHDVVC